MDYIDCLPDEVAYYVKTISGIRELRIRDGKPIKLNVNGQWFWLGANKLCISPTNALSFDKICNEFIQKACNSSAYAYEKMLAQGFFTMDDGTRVGVCGVMAASGVFQSYSSLCVRTAHFFSCVTQTFDKSVVVVGPPSSGKTTYLRDLACKLSRDKNVVVVDEREEITNCKGFADKSFCDVLCRTSKQYAFEVAVRTMSPDWVVCDELSETDFPYLKTVVASGVNLAASVHADSMSQLKSRLGDNIRHFSYAVFLQKNTFKQTVVNLCEPAKLQ